jgi:hypothetical protein
VSPTQSLPSAEAAAYAADQGEFWEYCHPLFANLGILAFNRGNLINIAKAIKGLDVKQFSACIDIHTY